MRIFMSLLLVLSFNAWAAQRPTPPKRGAMTKDVPCKSKEWPYARVANVKVMSVQFQHVPHRDLVQMAWGEILRNKEDSQALPILYFLAGNEKSTTLRGYYKTMARMIYREGDPEKALDKWPMKPKRVASPMNLKELCTYYNRASS